MHGATIEIINGVFITCFKTPNYKKIRHKCFHLGFEAGLNSAQSVAEENTDHYASKWVSDT